MKVFLSWSGELSHKIACEFRDWLPQLLNKAETYVSSEDIDKGERWSTDIAKELEASSFGIVFVTKENLTAPWINFEAGALSKSVERTNVVPFLFGLKRTDVTGPLLQFQSCIYEAGDVERLVGSVNRRLPEGDRRTESQLKTAFEVWWPRLKEKLDLHPATGEAPKDASEKRGPTALLEEVLEIVRSQQRILRDPVSLLPPRYLAEVLDRGRGRAYPDRLHSAIVNAQQRARKLRGSLPDLPAINALCEEIEELHDALHVEAGEVSVKRRRRIEERQQRALHDETLPHDALESLANEIHSLKNIG